MVVQQGLAPVPHTKEATAHRLRSLFARNRARLMGVKPAYTWAERAWDEALDRAMVRSPRLLTRLASRAHTVAPAIWDRIRSEAREIEREMRRQRELQKIYKLRRLANTDECDWQ
jgi:hypothetical protein